MTRVFRAADTALGLNGGDFNPDVIDGTGPTTFTHGGLNLPDAAGIYQPIAANDPPVYFHAGQNWLYTQPNLTNSIPFSRDLTNVDWNNVGGGLTVTFDQIGLDGAPNTASLLDDASAVSLGQIRHGNVAVPDDSDTHTFRVFVLKDTDQTRFARFSAEVTGGTSVTNSVQLNTQTGAIDTPSTGAAEARDAGLWWEMLVDITNNSTGNVNSRIAILPAYSTSLGGGQNTAAVGSIIVGNAELHI